MNLESFLIGFACGGMAVCVVWWRDIDRACRRDERLKRLLQRRPGPSLRDKLLASTLTPGREA